MAQVPLLVEQQESDTAVRSLPQAIPDKDEWGLLLRSLLFGMGALLMGKQPEVRPSARLAALEKIAIPEGIPDVDAAALQMVRAIAMHMSAGHPTAFVVRVAYSKLVRKLESAGYLLDVPHA